MEAVRIQVSCCREMVDAVLIIKFGGDDDDDRLLRELGVGTRAFSETTRFVSSYRTSIRQSYHHKLTVVSHGSSQLLCHLDTLLVHFHVWNVCVQRHHPSSCGHVYCESGGAVVSHCADGMVEVLVCECGRGGVVVWARISIREVPGASKSCGRVSVSGLVWWFDRDIDYA